MICKNCGGKVKYAKAEMYYYCPACKKLLDSEDIDASPLRLRLLHHRPPEDENLPLDEDTKKALERKLTVGPFVLMALSFATACFQLLAFPAVLFGLYLLRCVRQYNAPTAKKQRSFIAFFLILPMWVVLMVLIAVVRGLLF